MPGKTKTERNPTNSKGKGTVASTKSDEEVRESQWLGKALRRQQTQSKLQELAEQRKKADKPLKSADSEVPLSVSVQAMTSA